MMTVMFTDIERSTEMLERLGENRWLEIILTHNRIVRDCVSDHGGDVVKSQGDGFMLAFASARAAITCAVELQRALAEYEACVLRQGLRVRIGVHTGNIFTDNEDFLGRAVVLAARITGRARGGEILVSDACRDYTEHLGVWRYGQPTELRLKGLAAAERVHSVEWSERGRES
jgi:class 3 adenylate cyclase